MKYFDLERINNTGVQNVPRKDLEASRYKIQLIGLLLTILVQRVELHA